MYGPWWDDYSTPAYPGTHAQPGSHVHGIYDQSADMLDMFAGHTLEDDAATTHSSGGEIVIAAGLGTKATGGNVVMMGGYGLSTSSGSVTVKSVNAGYSGVSGELTFSSGTTSSGNSGYIAIGTGASTSGKAGAIDVRVGSGRTDAGGNMLMRAGQTLTNSKSGGRVTIAAGTGGQAKATFETTAKYSKQQHLYYKQSPLTHDHSTPAAPRESDNQYGPYYQDYHVQHRYDNGIYDESADMIDMFAGYTLADDANSDASATGGDVVVAAGLGLGATGGEVVMMSGYSLKTTSGAVTIKSTNAGASGVSGALSFSSGTTSSGNSGMLTIGSGAATSGKGGMIDIAVGSGNSGVGANTYVKAGLTLADDKDGGHVAVMAGTGGQSKTSVTGFFWVNSCTCGILTACLPGLGTHTVSS